MRSMTGFAQGNIEFNDIHISVSFKSLNHRFLDIGFRGTGITPRTEKIIKDILRDRVFRGKVEVVFNMFDARQRKFNIQFNQSLLDEILEKLLPVKDKYGEKIDLALDFLLKIPMIFHLEYVSDNFEDEDSRAIVDFIGKIFDEFIESREQEGQFILQDLLKSIDKIEASVQLLKQSSATMEADLFTKYKERIEKILQDYDVDEKRIFQEAAILAEKSCINEEINRLETHNLRLRKLLADQKVGIKGREADFLTQEMQRETHTISSKTDSMDILQNVLEVRREIEKIKQQVQNVE